MPSFIITNTDGRWTPDFQDLDSDDDGLCDVNESGINSAIYDGDSNGLINGTDSDGDGIKDLLDKNDSSFGSPFHNVPVNSDGAGKPDYQDLDSDDALTDGGDGSGDDVTIAGYSSYDANDDGTQHHGHANDAVHVKAFKTEHFVDAEPGHCL